jgi:hypothetical protein
MDKKLEILAEIQHEIWSRWMKYQFILCRERENGDLVIPAEKVERWMRQLQTPYNQLSEPEKQSDRDVVIEHNVINRLDKLS